MGQTRCTECGARIDPTPDSGHYRKVTGYVRLRRRGANEVWRRQDLDEYICRTCHDLISRGISPTQETLDI